MLRARLARSSFATTVGATVVVAGLSGLTGVIASHALGPYQRGLLATAVVWSTVVGSLSSYGLPQAGAYFVARELKQRPRFAGSMLALAAATGSALAIAGVAVSLAIVRGPASVPLAIAFAGQLPNLVAGCCLGASLGLGEFQSYARLRIVAPALALISVIGVIGAGWRTAIAVAFVQAGVLVVQAFLGLLLLRRRSLIGRPSWALLRPITKYMWGNMVSGAAWLVSLRLDQLFLSFAVAPSSLGIYAVAASFGEVMVPVAGSPGTVMLAQTAAGGSRVVEAYLRRAIKISLSVAGAYAAVTFLAAPLALRLLFGPGFEPGLASLRILLVGAVSLSVSSVLADTLRGLGHPLLPARAEVIGAAMTLTLLLVLVPTLGILGAAITSTVSYTTVLLVMARNLRGEMRKLRIVASPDARPMETEGTVGVAARLDQQLP